MTPGPQGHQAAPISRASGRSSPAVRSARLGAEASGWALRRPRLGPAAHRHPPNPSTCTARLRKVPASAANFFTLKSMMFILGGSRAELPADLAGRRRRLGRAGAPAGSGGADVVGGGRRRQLRRRSCRFRQGGARGRGEGRERTPPSPTGGGGGGREVGPVQSRGWPLTSRRQRAASRRRTDWRSDPVGPGPQRSKRAPAAGRGLYRGYRGNSDPFRTAAV